MSLRVSQTFSNSESAIAPVSVISLEFRSSSSTSSLPASAVTFQLQEGDRPKEDMVVQDQQAWVQAHGRAVDRVAFLLLSVQCSLPHHGINQP
jgi:hypothetical protein